MLKLILIALLFATAYSQSCSSVQQWQDTVRYFPGTQVAFNGFIQTATSINLGTSARPDNNAFWTSRIECLIDCSQMVDWSFVGSYPAGTQIIFFRRAYQAVTYNQLNVPGSSTYIYWTGLGKCIAGTGPKQSNCDQIPAWRSNQKYLAGDTVEFNGKQYYANSFTTAGTAPGLSPNWVLSGTCSGTQKTLLFCSPFKAFQNGVNYPLGEKVIYNDKLYTAVVDISGQSPDSAPTDWDLEATCQPGTTGGVGSCGQSAWIAGQQYFYGQEVQRSGAAWLAVQWSINADPAITPYWARLSNC